MSLAALSLTGCGDRGSGNDSSPPISIETDGASIKADGGKLAIDVPGLDAKVSIPNFTISGEHMDIDGLEPPPTTTITGIAVDEKVRDKGVVTMRFADTQPPAALIAHYRTRATANGYGVADAPDGLRLTKPGKAVAIEIAADAAGSKGRIVVSDQ